MNICKEDMPPAFQQLATFYGAGDMYSLIDAMESHIERLQETVRQQRPVVYDFPNGGRVG